METKIQELLTILKAKKLTLASCESFTGGMFADLITNIPGASEVFLGGYVTYSIAMKVAIGVNKRTIKKYGVVSQQVAEAMVAATRKKTKADVVVAFTGDAGPSVQENGQVGVGYFSFGYLGKIHTFKIEKPGLDRISFKKAAIETGILKILDKIAN